MLEVQSRAYREQYGCNFVTVIPCNIYGPNDNYNLDSSHVIPALINKCYVAKLFDTDFEIWGTGNAYREFVYSADVGKIVQWVLEDYDSPELLIISPDEEVCIATVAQKIASIMEYKGSIVYNGERDGIIRKPSDSGELKSLLPNFEFTTIDDGLEKSIKWFIENYERARKMSKIIDGKVGGELEKKKEGYKRLLSSQVSTDKMVLTLRSFFCKKDMKSTAS